MRRDFIIVVIVYAALLSGIWIASTTWKCNRDVIDTIRYDGMNDAPLEHIFRMTKSAPTASSVRIGSNDDGSWNGWGEPLFLQGPATLVEVPPDWSYETPQLCKEINDATSFTVGRENQKIMVHYHLQHNAGTEFFAFARQFVPCATRACWQRSKHCFVSYSEEIEAENIRNNYRDHGIQYVSYEAMLPPRFPLPFVSETAREGLFFTTIVRDPFKRFLSAFRRQIHKFDLEFGTEEGSPFWGDLRERVNAYSMDNLNVRWLSGALDQKITSDHVNIAKCRLQLFDLVISDNLMSYAIEKVLCPLFNWKGNRHCIGHIPERERLEKSDPLKNFDPILTGAWIERLRPSFEVYDYARLLSYKQMKERGVTELPELSRVPSYMETLAKYTNFTTQDSHFRSILQVSVEKEDYFHPPERFCNQMKEVWKNNPDGVPNIRGIGAIKGFKREFRAVDG